MYVLNVTSLKSDAFHKPLTCYPDLVHSDSSLDSGCHSIHTGTHPQQVNGLVLLTDGIFCMNPACLHITFLDSLQKHRKQEFIHVLKATATLGSRFLVNLWFNKPTCFTLAFSAFSSLSHFLELRCSSLTANLRLNKCSAELVKGMGNDINVNIPSYNTL